MHIKGALFDLDGTLLYIEPIYDAVTQQLINEFGNGKKLDWNIKQNIIGSTHKKSSKIFVEAFEINLTPEEFQKRKVALLIEPFKNTKFKKGARETTHKCKYNLGLKIAIATSSSKNNFENKTNHLKEWLNEDIDIVVTGGDIKEGKPSPDIFILAAKELGLETNECIVFEDGISWVKVAIAAGIGIVVAIIEKWQKDDLDKIIYDKNKTKISVLDSMEQFDFSIVK